MIEVVNLNKTFVSGVFKKHRVKAVDNVSFSIEQGKTLGIAGNSGCGKSTIARILLKLIEPDSGTIFLEGRDVTGLRGADVREYRKKVQIIFQNPESSLDPSKKIQFSLLEPMEIHHLYANREERMEKIREILELVGLNESLLNRYPHQISGGEAQRIMISRALTLNPSLIILDEPTSMLDVSIQAHVMTILKDLQQRLGLTYLFISHDLDVLSWLCDDLLIMNEGHILECGKVTDILANPKDPFTQELVNNFKLF